MSAKTAVINRIAGSWGRDEELKLPKNYRKNVPERSAPMQMTLSEFQSSSGVPVNEQIILIENPRFFEGYSAIMQPYSNSGSGKKALFKIRTLFNPNSADGQYFLPKNKHELFLGYFDRSMDDLQTHLLPVFKLIEKFPSRNFSLVIGKGDYLFDESFAEQMPKNLSQIIANNVDVRRKSVNYLPMGRDFRNLPLVAKFAPSREKTHLSYCNFSLDTHPLRQALFDSVKDQSFLTIDHMGKFLSYAISREEFLMKLQKSKFCICPRGNAVDTFRLWDCLYLGTVPIVVKEASFHEQLSDLPILFLDDYSDFTHLTSGYLEQVYERFQHTRFNYAKLTGNHWLSRRGGHLA